MIAASAALTLSGLPFLGPLGATKIGYIDNKFIVNPSKDELSNSKLELVVAGTKEGVLMIVRWNIYKHVSNIRHSSKKYAIKEIEN